MPSSVKSNTKAGAKNADTPFRRLLRRVAWAVGGAAIVAFAVEGGEYGTRDLLKFRDRAKARAAEVEALKAEVEALTAEYKAVTTDPARLERIAREEFGMVRGEKELLYWVGGAAGGTADSTVAADSTRPSRAEPPVDSETPASKTPNRG